MDSGIPESLKELIFPSAESFYNVEELFKNFVLESKSCEWRLIDEFRTVTQKRWLLIPSEEDPSVYLAKIQVDLSFCLETKLHQLRIVRLIPLDATLEELARLVDTLHGFLEE